MKGGSNSRHFSHHSGMEQIYRKTCQITYFWLFVKDIQFAYKIPLFTAHNIADQVWPVLPEEEQAQYRKEAKERKRKLKEMKKQGKFLPVTPCELLGDEAKKEIEERL